MLVEFSVANYLSFKERMTLSLVASKDRERPANTCCPEGLTGLSLLRSVAVYGANASGKTNLVRALAFMRRFVAESATGRTPGEPIGVSPFRLEGEMTRQPSELEAVFVHEGCRHIYGFAAERDEVTEEWLFRGHRRFSLLFHRHPGGEYEFGRSWTGDRRRLASLTRRDALFLSVAAQFGNPAATSVSQWFRDGLRPISISPESGVETLHAREGLLEDGSFARRLTEFLREADLGVRRLSAEPVPVGTRPGPAVALAGGGRRPLVVKSFHSMADGTEVEFDLDGEESAGTRRMFALAAPWLSALEGGGVVIADELDTHLHPLILRYLVRTVHQAQAQAQLILTTHDCGMLDAGLLRRDQIWFTEKDPAGATHLYSLWDYEAREGENVRNGYLRGRFGAIPVAGDLSVGQEVGQE